MTQKFTAEEVRDAAQTNEHPIPMRVRDMLRAYADTMSKPASPMQVDIYPLPDSLYPQSKDWMAADYAGRVEWLHAMYENRKDELDCFLAAQEQGDAVAEVIRNEAGQVYLKWAAKKSITDFTGAKFYTHPAPPASPAGVPDVLIHKALTIAANIRTADWLDAGGTLNEQDALADYLAAAPSAPEGDGGAE